MPAYIQADMMGSDIDRLIEQMHRNLLRTEPTAWRPRRRSTAFTSSVDPRKHDGYRVEVVNGEKQEYVYDDGEWTEVDSEEDEVSFEVTETPSGKRLIADLGAEITPEATTVSMSFNNGILEVDFETSTDSEVHEIEVESGDTEEE